MPQTQPKVVLCMKWGPLYPAAYVNVLHAAVRRNLTGPFRFVCLTPEPEGMDEGIETYPIPELGYGPRHWKSGAWPKLSVFVPDLYGLTGRALFIDLDSVIMSSLDPFFEEKGGLISIGGGPKWRRGSDNPNPSLASGVFAFDLGGQPQIAERFRADPEGAFDRFRIEQRFVQAHVAGWTTWPAEWIISFKKHLRRPIGIDRLLAPRLPDPSAKIVAFHGDPRPIDVIRPDNSSWADFPRYGRGALDWVRRYWLENGYQDPPQG
ncbi:MAG: hypothetical protein WBA91_09535 [Paracoccaceae bacterium]